MLSFNYKKGFFKINERIGTGTLIEQTNEKADVILVMELLLSLKEIRKFTKFKSSVFLLMPSYIIDLSVSEEQIFKNISKSTRRNIKKAMRNDNLKYVELKCPTDKQIENFSEFYNQFARKVNIDKCNIGKLQSIRDQKSLIISQIINENNQILCQHAHLCHGYQTYGIYSALRQFEDSDSYSLNGQIIGQANKYLDWLNIRNAKKRGCRWYNFGGKIMDASDKKGENVNHYKLSFGAITGYDLRIYSANSVLGKVFLQLLNFYNRKKRCHEYLFTQKVYEKNIVSSSMCILGSELVLVTNETSIIYLFPILGL